MSVLGLSAFAVLSVFAFREMRTSELQARQLSRIASEIGWELSTGASSTIRFPVDGPADRRAGYTRIGQFASTVEDAGFRIESQARPSPRFLDLIDRGLFPVYDEKAQVGLTIIDRHGQEFFEALFPQRVYPEFESIPPLVWRTLLHIESREFLDPRFPQRNPAIEWDRLARSVAGLGLRYLGRKGNVQGGSTLATQIEKFRHSPDGITNSPRDKLRQIASASIRAYLDGPETLSRQREIVRSYINSVPMAAQRGHGEVLGLAEGIRAWYGEDFDRVNELLFADPDSLSEAGRTDRALAYRQVTSLFIAHRRPSFYLGTAAGRSELATLTDAHLRILKRDSIIDSTLADRALGMVAEVQDMAPPLPPRPFEQRKAADRVRAGLLSLLGIPGLYDLDRIDLSVTSSIDLRWQAAAERLIRDLTTDSAFRAQAGFSVAPLLHQGDPAGVIYSIYLAEITDRGVQVRVQTDNYAGPMDFNSSARLELGSTAKLRTLVTYLELISELYDEVIALPLDVRLALRPAPQDRLTNWVLDWVGTHPLGERDEILDAALDRSYSANPSERFVTGGGTQVFTNFDTKYDRETLSIREGFRNSVNLVSIRTMRDIVDHLLFREPDALASVLEAGDLERDGYLLRFAREEGGEFVSRFFRSYADMDPQAILDRLVDERRLTPEKTAWAFRAVVPDAALEEFSEFIDLHSGLDRLGPGGAEELFTRTDPSRWDWADLGYLARIHPLELWVARYRIENLDASRGDAIGASVEVARDVYQWLFRTRRRNAQDARIRTILEEEAFAEILSRWRGLGYPFSNIVPSLGTAIGSSGDRASALIDLLAIIQNDGIRLPQTRVEGLRFGVGTPFETGLQREPVEGERVLPSEVAMAVRRILVDVVENGTGRRAQGVLTSPDGPMVVGGKTGTGDNRYRVFGPGGALLESRVVNRTSTFAFIAGDRYVGVIVAYVPGQEAEDYRFTSALTTQMLSVLGPQWSPLDGPVAGVVPSPIRR